MAGRLARLRRLSRAERRLLLRAWVYVLAAKVALATRPFPRVAARFAAGGVQQGRPDPDVVARTKRLVDIAARRHLVPMTCLPRALALQRLLGEQGIAAELKIGVHKKEGSLQAHAWLESAGEPLGEPEDVSERYAALAGVDRGVTGGP